MVYVHEYKDRTGIDFLAGAGVEVLQINDP
jgi:hypothetical protein